MVNVYCGDVLERTRDLYPFCNTMDYMYTKIYKKNAILIELRENKFIDIDDLLSGNNKVLNVYAFYNYEHYVDVKSLVSIREIKEEKIYRKLK